MAFLYALPGAVAEGLIWGLMAIGVYVSYKILDIADLTVDGSICTGACVCAILLGLGVPAWVSIIIAFIAGALAGIVTGLLHTGLGIPAILAGILTQLMLYSVNLAILGGRSLVAIDSRSIPLLVNMSDKTGSIISALIIVTLVIVCLVLFFFTEVGLTLKSTGDNPDMSRAQGVNVQFNKVLGLAIANGIVALAGALLAQYKGSANINDGKGAIVIGLAAIFIGLSVSLKIKPNLITSQIGVLKTDYLKMLSAIIVALFLGVPYLKNTFFAKPLPAHGSANRNIPSGGDADA